MSILDFASRVLADDLDRTSTEQSKFVFQLRDMDGCRVTEMTEMTEITEITEIIEMNNNNNIEYRVLRNEK